MKSKNTNLIYLALGAFMLVLLRSDMFIISLSFAQNIPIPYFDGIVLLLSKILSFIGSILFIFVSIKLIYINFNNKES